MDLIMLYLTKLTGSSKLSLDGGRVGYHTLFVHHTWGVPPKPLHRPKWYPKKRRKYGRKNNEAREGRRS